MERCGAATVAMTRSYRLIYGNCVVRKLHNEELNDPYCSPNIIRVIKSRRMRRAGDVARMEEGRGVHKVLVGET